MQEWGSVTMGWMGDHFTVVPSYIIHDNRVDRNALLAYVAVRSFMGGESMTCYPSISAIAARARVSPNTAREAVHSLRDLGYVEVVARTKPDGEPTSNLYKLNSIPTPTTGARTPNAGVPTPDVGGELYPDKKNHLTENLPVATLPAKPSPYRVFSDLFEERSGQKWSIDGKKEGANLAALVKWAKEMAPDGWEQYLRSFMDGAWALIHGDVLGLKASEREWWMSKPYTPSMLRSLRPHIVATMLAMESNNTASKEYMEQLEKDWGTKIRKRQALEAK